MSSENIIEESQSFIQLPSLAENANDKQMCDCNHEKGEFGPLCPDAPRPPDLPSDLSLAIPSDLSIALPPKIVFIVPYRDRIQQQKFFSEHMKFILEDFQPSDYKIYYVHQCDSREFNRGAMKNIGFLAIKEKYPNDYENITLVFNDIDTMPYTKNFLNYETTEKTVKHFYGYTYALGGIVSIKGADFEKSYGFPNFWAWGYEDNMLQKRVLRNNINIDRSQFYPIMDKNIFQMKDGLTRLVNRSEFDRFINDTTEGWQSIKLLEYEIDEETGFINVNNFYTGVAENPQQNQIHDLRNGSKPFNLITMPFSGAKRVRAKMGMMM